MVRITDRKQIASRLKRTGLDKYGWKLGELIKHIDFIQTNQPIYRWGRKQVFVYKRKNPNTIWGVKGRIDGFFTTKEVIGGYDNLTYVTYFPEEKRWRVNWDWEDEPPAKVKRMQTFLNQPVVKMGTVSSSQMTYASIKDTPEWQGVRIAIMKFDSDIKKFFENPSLAVRDNLLLRIDFLIEMVKSFEHLAKIKSDKNDLNSIIRDYEKLKRQLIEIKDIKELKRAKGIKVFVLGSVIKNQIFILLKNIQEKVGSKTNAVGLRKAEETYWKTKIENDFRRWKKGTLTKEQERQLLQWKAQEVIKDFEEKRKFEKGVEKTLAKDFKGFYDMGLYTLKITKLNLMDKGFVAELLVRSKVGQKKPITKVTVVANNEQDMIDKAKQLAENYMRTEQRKMGNKKGANIKLSFQKTPVKLEKNCICYKGNKGKTRGNNTSVIISYIVKKNNVPKELLVLAKGDKDLNAILFDIKTMKVLKENDSKSYSDYTSFSKQILNSRMAFSRESDIAKARITFQLLQYWE